MEAGPQDLYAVLGVARDATPPEIRKAYLRLVREHPPESDPEAFARVNDAYAVLGNSDKRAAYDAAPTWPDDALAAAKEAAAAANAERFDDACRLLEPAVAKHPALEPLERLYGQTLLGAERFADAAAIWRRAVERNPEDVGALYALAAAVGGAENGDKEEAIRLLKRALVLAPDEAEFAIGLARVQLRLRRGAEAATAFERGLARHAAPGLPRLALRVEALRGARFVPSCGDPAAALAALREEMARVEPEVANVAIDRLWRCGIAWVKEKRFDLAAALMDDVASLATNENAAAAARKGAESARADHAAREAALAFVAGSGPRWVVELVRALSLDGDLPRAKELLLRLASVASQPEKAQKAYDEFVRAQTTAALALERLEPHVRNALDAGLAFVKGSDYFRLLADPEIEPWIKEMAMLGHPARGVGHAATIEPLLQRHVAADGEERRAEIDAAAAAYPGVADDLRRRFAELAAAPEGSERRPPAPSKRLSPRERDSRRPAFRAPAGARRRLRPATYFLYALAMLTVWVLIRVGNTERRSTERAAPRASASRPIQLTNEHFVLTREGEIVPMNKSARRMLDRLDPAAVRRLREHLEAESGDGEGR